MTLFRARRYMMMVTALMTMLSSPAQADDQDFATILESARGQTVYFNAWGGDDKINDYIAWAGDELAQRHGITLKHVKLTDTAAAVSRILAEQAAGRSSGGSVDLLWVNGENFAALKRNSLLQGKPWAESLPSWRFTDATSLPAIRLDFAVPTDGLESPWGRAQLVFAHDGNRLATPPRNAADLATHIISTPGRFTYPQPPDFVGLSFLKQILVETAVDTAPLYKPVDTALFDEVTAPLWQWLDGVTPHLWRGGRAYPANYPMQRQLLADGEIDIAIAFNPADASSAIERGELPASVRTYIHDGGTIANVHFLAIPFNANAPEAARVVADFLLSPAAQIRKADPRVWGDPTVLAMHRLSDADRASFAALPRGVATLSEADLAATLAEPHPSWMKAIETEWRRRYASGG
ncbi:MAG: ABC transporter substrate-binding protein [Candidatus Puniceispirillaceae bacterium]